MIDLKLAIDNYHQISETTWVALQSLVQRQEVPKGELVLRGGNIANIFTS